MVDTLICYTCKKEYSQRWLKALEKAFYMDSNHLAVGTPFYREYNKEKDLFFCPMVVPIMSAVVVPIVWKGFVSSAKKDNIVLERVKTTDALKEEYDAFNRKELD